VVRAKVYLPIRERTSNTDKHEENHEKFMYLKYNHVADYVLNLILPMWRIG